MQIFLVSGQFLEHVDGSDGLYGPIMLRESFTNPCPFHDVNHDVNYRRATNR
jgi:hypothetical protein